MTLPKVVAVAELAAQGAGAIVYWELKSRPVDHSALKEAWYEAGLPDGLLLATPEPEVALGRAVAEQRASRRIVRKVKGAHVIVTETARTSAVERPSDVEYSAQATVKLDKVGRVQVVPFDGELYASVRSAYDRHLGELNEGDFSTWLATRLVPYVQGVALKSTGGTYFVPRSTVKTWYRIVEVLHAVSAHKIRSIPAMESTEALGAVLDAVEHEADVEVEAMTRDLAAGGMGVRALDTRVSRTEQVEGKVRQYEEMLGVRLDALHERLAGLRAQLTVAARKAEQAAEAEE